MTLLISLLITLSVFSFVLYYFFSKEFSKNNFLSEKLRESEIVLEQEENLSTREKEILRKTKEYENKYSPKQLVFFQNIAYCISIILFLLLLNNIGEFAFILLPIFIYFSYKFLDFYEKHLYEVKIKKFEEQFPTTIIQFISMLKANLTPQQAFTEIGKEGQYPIRNEFKRISLDINTGASFEKAMEDFQKRIPLSTVNLFSSGLIISSKASTEVLVQTLESLTLSIQKKNSERRELKSSTAQSRYTAIIISSIPILGFVLLNLFVNNYYTDMLHSTQGKMILLFGFILNFAGFIVATKIASPSKLTKK